MNKANIHNSLFTLQVEIDNLWVTMNVQGTPERNALQYHRMLNETSNYKAMNEKLM